MNTDDGGRGGRGVNWLILLVGFCFWGLGVVDLWLRGWPLRGVAWGRGGCRNWTGGLCVCPSMKMLFSAAVLAVVAATGWAAEPVVVRVTGERLVVNGQSEVPRGLFGVHAVALTPENIADMGIEATRQIHFHARATPIAIKDGALQAPYDRLLTIDCQNDRYAPATVLSNPKFAEYYTKLGTQYAEAAKGSPEYTFYTEFWNEPYLNWASRSHGAKRSNYYAGWYDVAKAVDGGPVTIKGWDKPLAHMKWKRLWAQGEDGKIYFGVSLPEGAKAGDTFKGRSTWYWTDRREQTFTVVEEWHVHDPSTKNWFSGKQNLDFYLWMFVPYAKAIKETNPKVQVLAGWDYGLSMGDYGVWKDLTQPLIDEAGDYIDGITDHHYGVDTRQVPAWYEIITTYGMSRKGRWIKGFNTECGGSLDPAVHGLDALAAEEKDALKKQWAEATYVLRDILELAYMSPDKVGSRTHHHAFPETGAAAGLRFLKDLRGELVVARTGDAEIWPVAAINGDTLVVAVFNNHMEERVLALAITPPAGRTFGRGAMHRLASDAEAKRLKVVTEQLPEEPEGLGLQVAVPGRQALKLAIPLAGEGKAGAERGVVKRTQYFPVEAKVVQTVSAEAPLELTIKVPAEALAGAKEAKLRVALDRMKEAIPVVELNGQAVVVPAREMVTDVVVPLGALREVNTLRVRSAKGEYLLLAASVYLEGVGE